MLRQYVLLRNAIHAKYRVSNPSGIKTTLPTHLMEPADQNVLLELNRRLAFELSDQTQILRPISKQNTKENLERLSRYLSERDYEAAICHVKANFTEIHTTCIVDLALQHGAYDFFKLFLRQHRFADFLSPDSLRKIVTQFSGRSLTTAIARYDSFAQKIGYDYLATLSIARRDDKLAYRLMTIPKLISRLSITKLYDLTGAYASHLGFLIKNLFDPTLREANPARDVQWISKIIDVLYFEYESVRSAIHQDEKYILYMLQMGSQFLSKEKLLAMQLTDPVLGNTIESSEQLKRTLGLIKESFVEIKAPTFMCDYTRSLGPDKPQANVKELGESLSQLEIRESDNLIQDKLMKKRSCACCTLM